MNHQECEALLTEHGIRPTANRIIVTKELDAARCPMSLTELANRILSVDISSIFRVLVLFREHHLVHVVDDGNGTVRYELCRSHEGEEDDDQHLHFFCESCKRTYCIHEVALPDIVLPHGFMAESVNYVVRGICPHCQKQR